MFHALACLGRFDVCFVSCLARFISGARGFLVIGEIARPSESPCLKNLVDWQWPLRFRRIQLALRLPKRGNTAMFRSSVIPLFSFVRIVPDPAPALTWTHVIAPRNFRDDTARALKTNTIWGVSLPTGAWLGLDSMTWLDWLGLHNFSCFSLAFDSRWCQAFTFGKLAATRPGTSVYFSLIYPVCLYIRRAKTR